MQLEEQIFFKDFKRFIDLKITIVINFLSFDIEQKAIVILTRTLQI